MTVLDKKQRLRPYAYPIFLEAHKAVLQSPWSPFEVGMEADVIDWSIIPEKESKIFLGFAKGFTLLEPG